MSFSASEKDTLQRLASRVAEIAADPVQTVRRNLWYKHNGLRPEKIMVLCFPEGSWEELLPESVLVAEDPLARAWEWQLLARIYGWEHIHDDQVTEATFDVPHVCEPDGWSLQEERIVPENRGAFTWKAPLKDWGDLSKLSRRKTTVDEEETRRRLDIAHELFDGILEVRNRGGHWWSLGITGTAIMLRGLGQLMLDIHDSPDRVHEMMSRLRDATMDRLDFLESNGLLCLNNGCDYVGSGGLGFSDELPAEDFAGTVRCKDMWGFGEAQEFVSVSPAMFEEFSLQYQLPMLERFGLNCYGCCEPLDTRLEVVKKLPRLRRISISPWADLEISAESLEDNFVFSYKPNPSVLAALTLDEELVRNQLREAVRVTEGCVLEMVMKDTHTVNRQPERIERWTQIAQEVAAEAVCTR